MLGWIELTNRPLQFAHTGTPEHALANETPQPTSPAQATHPRAYAMNMARPLGQPSRAWASSKNLSVVFDIPIAAATLKGRIKLMTAYRAPYAANSDFHCPGINGESPVWKKEESKILATLTEESNWYSSQLIK
jgi:hypothetical protein